MLTLALIIIFSLLACLGVVALKLTMRIIKRKSSFWGLNLRPIKCPKCYQQVPYIRTPKSTRQALWGGWTCGNCGIEIDKFGTDISSSEQIKMDDKSMLKSTDFSDPYDAKTMTPIERVIADGD